MWSKVTGRRSNGTRGARSVPARLALVGVVALTGVGAVVVGGPAIAATTSSESAAGALAERVSKIRDALTGLVDDGTITGAQADKVAGTLAETLPGRDGHHGGSGRGFGANGLSTAAEAMGLTEDELRTAIEAGDKSLAEIAADNGVDTSTLVDALVAAAKEHLAEEVAEGDLTQAEADARAEELPARVTEMVDAVPPAWGRHGRHGQHGRHGGSGPGGSSGDSGSSGSTTTPEVTPSGWVA